MRVAPITAEQADEQSGGFEPWRPGDYDFNVYDASEETSATGNEMIKLTLHVLNRDGERRTVFDYLVNSDKAQWKIRHFAEAVGMVPQYEQGDMDPHDITGRVGQLKLRIKPAQGQYSAQNAVNDYIPMPAAPREAARRAVPPTAVRPPTRQAATASARDLDDDIPF